MTARARTHLAVKGSCVDDKLSAGQLDDGDLFVPVHDEVRLGHLAPRGEVEPGVVEESEGEGEGEGKGEEDGERERDGGRERKGESGGKRVKGREVEGKRVSG